jgi:hypothetical protein
MRFLNTCDLTVDSARDHTQADRAALDEVSARLGGYESDMRVTWMRTRMCLRHVQSTASSCQMPKRTKNSGTAKKRRRLCKSWERGGF